MNQAWDRTYGPVHVSADAFKGNERKTMEDRVMFDIIQTRTNQYLVAAVFDGHGGEETAEYAANAIVPQLNRNLNTSKEPRQALIDAIHAIDQETKHHLSGSTLTVLLVELVQPFRTWCANYGDSQGFGMNLFNADPLSSPIREITRNHNIATNLTAQKRVKDSSDYTRLGPHVVHCKTGTGLAMTGFIGDAPHRPIRHELHVVQVRKHYDTFVIASDGFHDIMSPKDLYAKTKEFANRTDAAHQLSRYRNGVFPQHDNTSIVVVSILPRCRVQKK